MQLRDTLQVTREIGLSWAWRRGLHEVALRTGVLERRFERQSVDSAISSSLGVATGDVDSWLIKNWHESKASFFLGPNLREYKSYVGEPWHVIAVADDALYGKILLFSKWQADLDCLLN